MKNSRLIAVVDMTQRTDKPKPQPRWARYWRYWFMRLRRLRGKPRAIALGLAIGTFAGSFPFVGFQTLLGVLLATLLRGNKIAAVAGTWISNPLTYVPIYFFNFKVGQLLLGWHDLPVEQLEIHSWDNVMESGMVVARTLLVGSSVVGLGVGACTYFLSLWFISRWRERRNSKGRKPRRQIRPRRND